MNSRGGAWLSIEHLTCPHTTSLSPGETWSRTEMGRHVIGVTRENDGIVLARSELGNQKTDVVHRER